MSEAVSKEFLGKIGDPDKGVSCNPTLVADQPCGTGERRKSRNGRGDQTNVPWYFQKRVAKRNNFKRWCGRASDKLNPDFGRVRLDGFGKISKPLGSLITKVDDERMKCGGRNSSDVFFSWHDNILAHAPVNLFGGSHF